MSKRLEWLDFARELASEAAGQVMRVYETDFAVEFKDDRSPVTSADRDAEALIRNRIEERFPEHAIIGEEFGTSGPQTAKVTWIIDPIDGTMSLTRRVPLFGTLIAAVVDGEAIVGVAHFPALDSTAFAAVGHGAFLDDAPISVSQCARVEDALVCATGFHFTEFDLEADEPAATITPLLRAGAHFRGWGDCYGHVMVASGRADVMVDFAMNAWDNAALLPILNEAGASVSTLNGQTDRLIHGGSLVSAAPEIHRDVIRLLNASEQAQKVSEQND